uniref:hypothetical protein n=1 Tax=uncultured Sphingomonas sp. TaxID=158754 RepID=UPI0035CA32E8
MATIAALVTMLLIVRLWRMKSLSSTSRPRLFSMRAYQIAVVAEVFAIYAASAVLPRFGLQGFFIQIVGIIVGLHFIGLWAATRSERFLGIAAGMCIISAVAIPLPVGAHLANLRDVFTGFGNALVLWIGASRSP